MLLGARGLAITVMALWLTACAGPGRVIAPQDGPPGSPPPDIASIPDAQPQWESPSRYGNPASYVVNGQRYYVLDSADGFREQGIASWYGKKFHGRRTSSGEPYDMYQMTAAHKSLPLPSYVRVTHMGNGRSIVVKVNDRGPFAHNRIIDLSYAAAAKLNMLGAGTAPVEIAVVTPDTVAAGSSAGSDPPPAENVELTDVVYYLQVGAFAEQANAERMRQRLDPLAAGAVLIEPTFVESRQLFRVRLGPYNTIDAVDNAASRLANAGIERTQTVVIHPTETE